MLFSFYLELTFFRYCPLAVDTAAFVHSPCGRFISYCAKRGERITFCPFREFVNNTTRGDDPVRFTRSCRRYYRAC